MIMKATTYRIILILSGFTYLYIVICSAALTFMKGNIYWDFGDWEIFLLVFTILHCLFSCWLFTRYRKAYLYETHDFYIFGQITETISFPEEKENITDEEPIDIMDDDKIESEDALRPSYEEVYMSEEFHKLMNTSETPSERSERPSSHYRH